MCATIRKGMIFPFKGGIFVRYTFNVCIREMDGRKRRTTHSTYIEYIEWKQAAETLMDHKSKSFENYCIYTRQTLFILKFISYRIVSCVYKILSTHIYRERESCIIITRYHISVNYIHTPKYGPFSKSRAIFQRNHSAF